MTYVIVQNCCNDASCIDVCPVDCIHPTPDEPDFATAEMLYINPADCIDCGACVDACPVSAIHADYELPAHLQAYEAVNADYFTWMGSMPAASASPRRAKAEGQTDPVRVAVVGAGPSGWYVAEELVSSDRALVEVTVLDKAPTPHGLLRYGVAPDHLETKKIAEAFERTAAHPRVTTLLNVEIGVDLTHDELLERHHAVVYCTGAAQGRRLGIPGEDLPGSWSAPDFVHWYNGHPDFADLRPDLATERAVVIGTGNVALDIARVLLMTEEQRLTSDLPAYAVAALADSEIREVVILGRRGPEHAAFSSPELRALLDLDNLDVIVDAPGGVDAPVADAGATDYAVDQKLRLLRGIRTGVSSDRRIVLRFGVAPTRVLGSDHVEGLEVTHGDGVADLPAGLVVRSIGYTGKGVAGVPFDDEVGRFVHDAGRVRTAATGETVPGSYTAGWTKRGPTGVLGTNRPCASETVGSVLDDYVSGSLADPTRGIETLSALLVSRGVTSVGMDGWHAIDAVELARGRDAGRPRLKITSRSELLEAASARSE